MDIKFNIKIEVERTRKKMTKIRWELRKLKNRKYEAV